MQENFPPQLRCTWGVRIFERGHDHFHIALWQNKCDLAWEKRSAICYYYRRKYFWIPRMIICISPLRNKCKMEERLACLQPDFKTCCYEENGWTSLWAWPSPGIFGGGVVTGSPTALWLSAAARRDWRRCSQWVEAHHRDTRARRGSPTWELWYLFLIPRFPTLAAHEQLLKEDLKITAPWTLFPEILQNCSEVGGTRTSFPLFGDVLVLFLIHQVILMSWGWGPWTLSLSSNSHGETSCQTRPMRETFWA